MAHELNWEPGNEGKGVVVDGDVHTWNVDEYGDPHHADYLGLHRDDDTAGVHRNNLAFYIEPDGRVEFSVIAGGANPQLISDADPRLMPQPRQWQEFQAKTAAPAAAFAAELNIWLNGFDPEKAMMGAMLSPHHNTPHDFVTGGSDTAKPKPKPQRKKPRDVPANEWEQMKLDWALNDDAEGRPYPFPPQPEHWRHDHLPHLQAGSGYAFVPANTLQDLDEVPDQVHDWRPGTWGKVLVRKDNGDTHVVMADETTWDGRPDPQGGEHTHTELAHGLGIEQYPQYAGWVDKEGNYQGTLIPKKYLPAVYNRIKELGGKGEPQDWGFQASQELPKVFREQYGRNQGHGVGSPFFFFPDRNEIHVGTPGGYHSMQHIPHDYDPWDYDVIKGRVSDDNIAYYGDNDYGIQKYAPLIERALHEQTGYLDDPEGDYTWDWAAEQNNEGEGGVNTGWRDQFQASAPTPPPNYREHDKSNERCGTCKMQYQGECWGYGNTPVEADHVCDSWAKDGA